MKLKELIEQHTVRIVYCGNCECGERKYDLITDHNLAYPPFHESTIRDVKPELLEGKVNEKANRNSK
ncbi:MULTISPECIES: hypothetical protein [Enterococcus]|uniref:Uncharacterized protein n=1 Tax=Candidatus Enterococcus murrayae TaxID=2815321 RepID=A0ABS3HEQ4_9ENTE|nr:hypothetical protein [Enterococcus sp. MJM16]MBO0451947.1 hypothetical protein [Enterococcus sp. MJM16]